MKPLKKTLLVISSIAAFASAQAAELKLATIDMEKLVKEYHKTDGAQKDMSLQQTRIQTESNTRLERIREIQTELESLRKELNDSSLAENKRKEIVGKFQEKQAEGIALDRERREFIERRTRALNEKMSRAMNSIIEEINTVISEKARTGNYDFVLDRSKRGGANGVVAYSKDSYDITPEILTELNKNAPAKSDIPADAPATEAPAAEVPATPAKP